MTLRLRESVVRKHIHSWKLVGIGRISSCILLGRQCADCDLQQHGFIPYAAEQELPESLWCLADTTWRDGELNKAYDAGYRGE